MTIIKSYKIIYNIILYLVIICGLLSGCSSGTCRIQQSDNNIGITGLTIGSMPNGYYIAGESNVVVIPLQNDSAHSLKSLNFGIAANTTEGTVYIEDNSAAACASIAESSICLLKIKVASNTKPGSITLEVTSSIKLNTPSKNNVLVDKHSLISQPELKNNSSNVLYYTIGINSSLPDNKQVGINGLLVNYPQLVNTNNGSNLVVITTNVVSSNIGVFNQIELQGINGENLESYYQVISANSGVGYGLLTRGNSVTFMLKLPLSFSSFPFRLVLKYNNTPIPDGVSNIYYINQVQTQLNQGILSLYPEFTSLNDSYSTQVVSLYNQGSGAIKNVSVSNNITGLNIEENSCNNIEPNSWCNFKITKKIGVNVFGQISIGYNDNVSNKTSISTVLGTSESTTSITSGQLQIYSPNNLQNYYSSAQSNPIQTSLITFQNNQQYSFENITFDIPEYFTIKPSSSIDACDFSKPLAPNSSCTMLMTYNNSNVTPLSTVNFTVHYKYLISGVSYFNSNTLILQYVTNPSIASIITQNNSYNFGNVFTDANAAESFIFTNIGNAAASITINALPQPFSVESNNCSGSLSPGASCSISIDFNKQHTGSIGAQNTTFILGYNDSYNKNVVNIPISLSGNINTKKSASISPLVLSQTGFDAGNGSFGNPYIYENGSNGTKSVTYKITNTGAGDASNFNLVYSSNDLYPWTVTNNCHNLLLSGDTCTVIFTFGSSNGSYTLPLSTIYMSYIDDSNLSGNNIQFSNNNVYANAYPVPQILFNDNGNYYAGISSSVLAVATLTGGYNVPSQRLSFTADSGFASLTPSSCVISSINPVCPTLITLSNQYADDVNQYQISVSNTGSVSVQSTIYVQPRIYAYYVSKEYYPLNQAYLYKCYITSESLPTFNNCEIENNLPSYFLANGQFGVNLVNMSATMVNGSGYLATLVAGRTGEFGLFLCSIDLTSGEVVNCPDSSNFPYDDPQHTFSASADTLSGSVSMNTLNSQTYAFLSLGSSVSACLLNENKDINAQTCKTNYFDYKVGGIQIINNVAYLNTSNGGYSCNIDDLGNITNCNNSAVYQQSFYLPSTWMINVPNLGNVIYVTTSVKDESTGEYIPFINWYQLNMMSWTLSGTISGYIPTDVVQIQPINIGNNNMLFAVDRIGNLSGAILNDSGVPGVFTQSNIPPYGSSARIFTITSY